MRVQTDVWQTRLCVDLHTNACICHDARDNWTEHFILEPELTFILESDQLFTADHVGNREETHLHVQTQQQKHRIQDSSP